MAFIQVKNKIFSNNKVTLSYLNRSFRYGDGLFESIRMLNGKMPFLNDHISRIIKGMGVLKIDIPKYFTADFFESQIHLLAKQNKIGKNAKVKIIVWRNSKGLYTPDANKAGWLMEIFPMNESNFILNKKGLTIDVFDGIKKSTDILSNFKTNNALLFIITSIFVKEKKLDDALILNHYGRICEAISSNVFLVGATHGSPLLTPPLSEGCIGGVMRKNILKIAKQNGIAAREKPITIKDIEQADEMFVTNAIDGIQWVGEFRKKKYQNTFASKISKLLNEQINIV